MISGALWNIILGIAGGIISSVIVSRVFLLQSEIQNYLDSLEFGLNKINYLHGMMHVLKIILQQKYDEQEKKHSEMEKKGYKTEAEYYAAHKGARWIDADELQKEIIQKANAEADKIYDELRNMNVKGKEANKVMQIYVDYVTKIQSMQEVPFSLIDETTRLHDKAIAQFTEYKKKSSKRLLKRLFTDKVMIVLYSMVLTIIVTAVAAKVAGL